MSLIVHQIDASHAKQFSLRGAVSSPIRVLHLADLGIDGEGFLLRIGPTFHKLPLDPYDTAIGAEQLVKKHSPDIYRAHETEWLRFWNELGHFQFTDAAAGAQFWRQYVSNDPLQRQLEGLRPYRRRSSFQYFARPCSTQYKWELRELGAPTFMQAVDDSRARPREFVPSPLAVYRDEDIQRLIAVICQIVRQAASVMFSDFRVTLHQMITYASEAKGSKPSPEGIHQDGCPFIVSGLVIERHNVTGGVSEIYYTKSGDLALRHELQPGEGIFQSDTHNAYWHGVTPIYSTDVTQMAFRSILGLDIDFVR